MIEHTVTPWETSVLSTGLEWAVCMVGGGDQIAMGLTETDANRIVACVHACADIPTGSLTALDWQLAPKAGARPIDVAKLLLKMGVYRNAMARLVVQAKACNFTDEEGHQLTMNTAYQAIQEALR